jgi:hypothetical protein
MDPTEIDPTDYESSDELAEIDFDVEIPEDSGLEPEHPVYGSYDAEAESEYRRGLDQLNEGETPYYQEDDGA